MPRSRARTMPDPEATRSEVRQRRDGRFDVRITVRERGRRYRFGTTAATRGAAEAALPRLWHRWYTGALRPVDPTTLRLVLEDWMGGLEARNTLQAAEIRVRVRPTVERYLLAGLGDIPVQR